MQHTITLFVESAEESELLEAINELVPKYLRDCEQTLATIPELLEARDFEGIRTIGHNLKGSGTPYGFPEISRLGAAMEGAAESRKASAVAENLAALHRLTTSLRPDA
jgi:HPt (histidine-containing phosphotransfer) domain-containing protein